MDVMPLEQYREMRDRYARLEQDIPGLAHWVMFSADIASSADSAANMPEGLKDQTARQRSARRMLSVNAFVLERAFTEMELIEQEFDTVRGAI